MPLSSSPLVLFRATRTNTMALVRFLTAITSSGSTDLQLVSFGHCLPLRSTCSRHEGFTLIAAFWGQVVYRAKQLAPWQLMAEGPQPAERSILLDFVSPFNPTFLFRSLRTPGTRTVTLAIIGSMLLRLITILSTGLFFVQSILMEHEHKASVLDTFSDPILTDFNSSSIDHRPISRVSAINSNNLPYPLGTTPDYAFQQIDLTNGRLFQLMPSCTVADICKCPRTPRA